MSKRAGAVSAETKETILHCARDEFARKGFQGTSLRRIASAAGVTTGAIYFFFEGKDDLFEAVVSAATEPFMGCMMHHYQSEHDFLDKPAADNLDEDLEVSVLLIDFYFQQQTTWDIIRTHQDHPVVRRFLDGFVTVTTEHYLALLDMAAEVRSRQTPVDRFAVHQFSRMQVEAMMNLISHGFSREELVRHSATVTKMLRAAFNTLLDE